MHPLISAIVITTKLLGFDLRLYHSDRIEIDISDISADFFSIFQSQKLLTNKNAKLHEYESNLSKWISAVTIETLEFTMELKNIHRRYFRISALIRKFLHFS